MFERILVGLKEGAPPQQLLELAKRVGAPGAALNLVTLVKVGAGEDQPARLQAAEEELQELVRELEQEGFDGTSVVRPIAVAAGNELLQIAEAREVELIVVGLAKRSRVGKALLGGDAQAVLLTASCPVLSVRLE